jgi:hypothetical protein
MSHKNDYNNLDSMLNDMAQTVSSIQLPNKITILNNNTQVGGSKPRPEDKVNKLLSMLATESHTSQNDTAEIEQDLRNMLKLKGGKSKKKDSYELKAFFKKYNIKTINGIKSNQFLVKYTGDDDDASNIIANTTSSSASDGLPSQLSDSDVVNTQKNNNDQTGENKITQEITNTDDTNTDDTNTDNTDNTSATSTTNIAGGARGMNPGFKAFIDLKKKIAESLKIPNGPKAAKIAGAIQKEMKVKYPDLTSVQLAAKGLEHFNKDSSKYKKMV